MLQKHSIKIDKTSTKELHLIFVDDCIFWKLEPLTSEVLCLRYIQYSANTLQHSNLRVFTPFLKNEIHPSFSNYIWMMRQQILIYI